MEEVRAYTKREWVRAVNASAILGWLALSSYPVFKGGIGLLPWFAAFGLPIAFISCWAIVAPILWRVMRKPISWLSALVFGATISATMVAVSILFGRLNGLRISRDPHFNFQHGGGEFITEMDGILTPYGWWVLLQSSTQFILIGVAIALLTRAIIGSGSSSN